MIELDFHETLTVWGEHLAINRDMNWRGMGTHASNPSSIWRLLCSVSMPDLTKMVSAMRYWWCSPNNSLVK